MNTTQIKDLLLEVFKELGDDGKIRIRSTCGGPLPSLYGESREDLLKKLDGISGTKLIAVLNQLAQEGILDINFSKNGNEVYSLTAKGYGLIEEQKLI